MTNSSFEHATRTSRSVGCLQVADLAGRAGVTPATVRYYARIGLLNPGRNDQNGYRRFTADDLHRVIFIRKAQALGLTIADIRSVLEHIERGQSVSDLVVELVQRRIGEIRRQCAELEATSLRAERALEKWSDSNPRRASELCPLIERVEVDSGAGAAREHARVRLRIGDSTGRPSPHLAAALA